jgi:hypothetical protein
MFAALGTTEPASITNSVGTAQPNELITVTLNYTTQTHIYARAASVNTDFFTSSIIVDRQFQADLPPDTPSITSIVPNIGNNVINWSYSGTFIDGFYILRSPNLQGTAPEDILVGYIAPSVFRFVDFNVGSQISYTYRVVARNRIGIANSAPSTVLSTTMTPAPPSNLVVTTFGLASPEGDFYIEAKWQNNSAGFEDGFTLQRLIGGTWTPVNGAVKFVTTSNDIVNVEPAVTITFSFRVLAYNRFGSSAPSNTAQITLTG